MASTRRTAGEVRASMSSAWALALSLSLFAFACTRHRSERSAAPAPDPESAPRTYVPDASPGPQSAWRDAGPSPSSGCGPSLIGKTYDVGDDQSYKTVSRVPWASLLPGDAVRIHWRPEPYREKILVSQSGTARHPIRICGVAGPNGERPILDAENATTDASFQFVHAEQQGRGLIIVSLRKNGQESGDKPRYIVIEGLELRNAGPPRTFHDAAGETRAYPELAACVFVERGEHITLRGNEVHGCGNGLFVASGDSEAIVSRDILIEGNFIHGNGTIVHNTKQHSIYTEAVGIVFQYNRFGPLLEGSLGNQIKDRSVGTVVRYNWFEGGSRAMDLVEPEESLPMVANLPALHETFVYGNVVAFGARTSSRPIHYGGDNGSEKTYRKGTLFFYDNTIVLTTNESEQPYVAVLQLQTDDESADVRNNVVYISGTAHLSWLFERGRAKLGVNWVSRSITDTAPRVAFPGRRTGTVELLPGGRTIAGDSPGFVDGGAGDYCLAPSSPARGVGGALAPGLPPSMLPTSQYRKHRDAVPRPERRDLGALVCD